MEKDKQVTEEALNELSCLLDHKPQGESIQTLNHLITWPHGENLLFIFNSFVVDELT